MDITKLEDALETYRSIDPTIGAPSMLAFLVIARLRDARPSDVQHRLRVTITSAVRNVQYWESRGYIVREPDPRDARATRLVLTPKGQELYQRLRDI